MLLRFGQELLGGIQPKLVGCEASERRFQMAQLALQGRIVVGWEWDGVHGLGAHGAATRILLDSLSLFVQLGRLDREARCAC